ncbi:response regulator [Prosthecochloris marina]|nr:response regulator [Prosthecochloris marina]
MRNPLNSIINAIESLQSIIPDKPGKQEKDKYQQYKLSRSGLISLHNVIEESSEIVIKANKIIDSILAGMQGKSLSTNSFKRITAKSCIHSTINSFSYNTLEEHKLVKDLSKKDFNFFGDKDLLVYVLFNLIKNALHYKKKPGFTIEISTETSSNGNTIKVRDTGPGIPASKKEKIFDEFYTSGKKNGIGLGLSFCKRVLTSFGGQITCNSKENEWTEFILHFPLYHSKEAEYLKKEVLHNKNILIVDNNSNNRRITDKYFSEWHCNTRQVQNGTQALSMLLQQHFDLILINLELPTVSGDEVAKQIRRKKHNPQFPATNYKEIPIIGFSNHSESKRKQRLLGSEMNELIPKPPRRKHIHLLFEKYFFSETEPLIHNPDIFLDNADILIVDDNHTSRKFISFVLERMGARVMQAENGEEALEHLEKNDYELIFMDMEMPVLNGINTTRIIREGKRFKRFGKYREIPIIALTGNTDDANITLAKQSGMNDHLGKPFGKEDLARVLSTWLQPQ